MQIAHLLLVVLLVGSPQVFGQKTVLVNPNDIQLSPYRHSELPSSLLKRIRVTTDVFERIDGVSYEKAVDLYKRDLNPEENLVLWEEMVRGYLAFCKSRCATEAERGDVYRALLLRSMFEESDAIQRTNPKVLTASEVRSVVKLYHLPAKPIDVVKRK
jgi:hypothetical protein